MTVVVVIIVLLIVVILLIIQFTNVASKLSITILHFILIRCLYIYFLL